MPQDLTHYRALATDYDGTLATGGNVEPGVIAALARFVASGRQLLLVTGRELPDLKRVFPALALFARVVAENGALVYDPATGREELLCAPAPTRFVNDLRRQGVPLSVGRAIVATREPHLDDVRRAIARSGLELHITLNKGGVMVLPAGITKAHGLRPALRELGLASDDVVGIGDAENDCDFLGACGLGVAVANALPSLKKRAHLVTAGAHGAGVVEIMERLLGLPSITDQEGPRLSGSE